MKKIALTCAFMLIILVGCAGNSPVVQQMADSAQQMFNEVHGDDGNIKVTVIARGDTLVYTYQASNPVTSSADEIAVGVENATVHYDGILKEMRSKGVKEPAVIVEYLDMDGGMIYTREFK